MDKETGNNIYETINSNIIGFHCKKIRELAEKETKKGNYKFRYYTNYEMNASELIKIFRENNLFNNLYMRADFFTFCCDTYQYIEFDLSK